MFTGPHSKETRRKMSLSLLGHPVSYETKKKISMAHKGKPSPLKGVPRPLGVRKKISLGNKGTVRTKEYIEKMRRRMIGRKLTEKHRANISLGCAGEKNGMWKGGLSLQPYSSEFNFQFKELIKQRDNYICQLCGTPECESTKTLRCHHIDYNKENTLPTNIISLCFKCNIKVNNNRQFWADFFNEKMKSIQNGYQLKLDYLIREGKSKYPIVTGRGIIG